MIGLAGLGSGAVAVFVTHLEVGPVGLLAVGFLLLVIGIGGRMPSRLKLGDNEAEWQDEREAVQEFVERVAVNSQDSKRMDLISALDQLAAAAPDVANPALSAMAYEALALDTIAELSRGSTRSMTQTGFSFVTTPGRSKQIADAILEATDGTKIAVEIKAYRSDLPLDVIRRVYGDLQVLSARSNIGVTLLISRVEPRPTALNFLSSVIGVHLVVLRDAKDAATLEAAIYSAFDTARSLERMDLQDN